MRNWLSRNKAYAPRPTLVGVFIVGALLLPSTAYAYVDPGSGSVLVTTVLGLIAAIGYTCRKFFYNLRRKLFGDSKPDDDRSLDD